MVPTVKEILEAEKRALLESSSYLTMLYKNLIKDNPEIDPDTLWKMVNRSVWGWGDFLTFQLALRVKKNTILVSKPYTHLDQTDFHNSNLQMEKAVLQGREMEKTLKLALDAIPCDKFGEAHGMNQAVIRTKLITMKKLLEWINGELFNTCGLTGIEHLEAYKNGEMDKPQNMELDDEEEDN